MLKDGWRFEFRRLFHDQTQMRKSYRIELNTERFDQKSELPPDVNAGNRFYGADVARYIISALSLDGFSVIDEDWGWLVYGTWDLLELQYGISDWHDVDQRFGGNPEPGQETLGNWCLVVSAYEKRRILGMIPYLSAIDCPERYGRELVEAFANDGIGVISSGLE